MGQLSAASDVRAELVAVRDDAAATGSIVAPQGAVLCIAFSVCDPKVFNAIICLQAVDVVDYAVRVRTIVQRPQDAVRSDVLSE